MIARGLHPAECRRLIRVCALFQLDSGPCGHIRASELALLLRLALRPVTDAQLIARLLDEAPQPASSVEPQLRATRPQEATLEMGKIVKFWFDCVWPKTSKKLLQAHHSAPT